MNSWIPLIAATLGWGLSNVLGKAVLNDGVDTFTYLPLRYAIGLITLLGFLAATGRIQPVGPDAWKKGALLGLVNMSVPTMLMTKGLEFIPATVGSLLIALIPIATVSSAHFVVAGERFKARTLPGLIVSLVGVSFLIDGGIEVVPRVSDLIIGVVLTTLGVLLAGVGGAVSRRFALKTPPSQLVLPQFVVGLVSLLIALPLFGSGDSGISTISSDVWWLILASGTLGTAVPFAAILFAAEHSPASRLAITGYVVPVLATIGAILFLGESFSSIMIFAAILILAGVYWSERAANYEPTPVVRSTA